MHADLHLLPEGKVDRVDLPLGRNCSAFDETRLWSYRAVGDFKRERTLDDWQRVVSERVGAVNSKFSVPLPGSEVRSIAKSIANWTWVKFRGRDPKAAEKRKAAW